MNYYCYTEDFPGDCGMQVITNFPYPLYQYSGKDCGKTTVTKSTMSAAHSSMAQRLKTLPSNCGIVTCSLNDKQRPFFEPMLRKFGFKRSGCANNPNSGRNIYMYCLSLHKTKRLPKS